MARLVIENLSKHFAAAAGQSVRAVDRLSLTVEDRELFTLVGPSGSGKTTALRLIAGLETADEGTISLDGRRVERLAPAGRDVAMVFQNRALYPHFTARENLASGLVWRKFPRAEIEARVRQTAELLELTGCLEQLPETLSGGQAQRVALGRALVLRPKLFLLDEPLSNLDGPLRAQLRRELKKLHQQLGITMLHVTHDQSEALALGDRVAVMHGGALQQAATPRDLYERPANVFTAGFVGTPPMNFLRGSLVAHHGRMEFQWRSSATAKETDFSLPLREAPAAALAERAGQEVLLGVRPENVFLRPSDEASARAFAAEVELVESTGAESHVHVRCGGQTLVALERSSSQWLPGAAVRVELAETRLHFFDPQTGRAIP